MFLRARENICGQSLSKNQIYSGLRRVESKFKVGDNVMLKSHPIFHLVKAFSAKLTAGWRSPFVVAEQLSPVNFIISR